MQSGIILNILTSFLTLIRADIIQAIGYSPIRLRIAHVTPFF